jgi:ribosomal protein L29
MKIKERVKDFQRMANEDLKANLKEKQEHLRRLWFDLAGGKVKNIREIRQTRRDIARILTLLKQKI